MDLALENRPEETATTTQFMSPDHVWTSKNHSTPNIEALW